MPCESVNHTRLAVEYAVPTPSFELELHLGGIPGRPGAWPTLLEVSLFIECPCVMAQQKPRRVDAESSILTPVVDILFFALANLARRIRVPSPPSLTRRGPARACGSRRFPVRTALRGQDQRAQRVA